MVLSVASPSDDDADNDNDDDDYELIRPWLA